MKAHVSINIMCIIIHSSIRISIRPRTKHILHILIHLRIFLEPHHHRWHVMLIKHNETSHIIRDTAILITMWWNMPLHPRHNAHTDIIKQVTPLKAMFTRTQWNKSHNQRHNAHQDKTSHMIKDTMLTRTQHNKSYYQRHNGHKDTMKQVTSSKTQCSLGQYETSQAIKDTMLIRTQ